MRIGYLECFAGISGDMLLGALVDGGVSAGLLEQTARSLNVGAELRLERVDRSGITGRPSSADHTPARLVSPMPWRDHVDLAAAISRPS